MRFTLKMFAMAVAVMVAGGIVVPGDEVQAQSTSTVSQERCQRAVTRLAETDGRDTDAAAIALSKPCEAIRQANSFDVRDGMAEMARLLRTEGVDFEAGLRARLDACEKTAEEQFFALDANDRTTARQREFYDRCAQNSRVAAYSEGIVQLQELRQARFAAQSQAVAAEEERLDREYAQAVADHQRQVEAEERAHQARMAEWRRRVALCESGQHEFCAE